MKLKAFLGTLAVALGLSYQTAKADPPSGVEFTGGFEKITETRPEVDNKLKLEGVHAALELPNLRVGDFMVDAEAHYRSLKKGLNGLETLTASFKPGYVVFERFGPIDISVAPGISAVYHKTTGDSVELIPDLLGLVYIYSSSFVAPRIKCKVVAMDLLYSELATEVGAGFLRGNDVRPYVGLDARVGIEYDFNKHFGVNVALFEEGRILKGEHFVDFGGELRVRVHNRAPKLVVKGSYHTEKNEYFSGKGGMITGGLGF